MLLLLCTAALAGPGPLLTTPPPGVGYSLIQSDTGVKLYEQPWESGAPDYVLEIDLTQAWVSSLIDPSGDELWRHTVPELWDLAADRDGRWAVLNGAFFSMSSDPTSPAFGLRADPYDYVHSGYGTHSEYVDEQLSLHIRNEATRAAIVDREISSLADPDAAPEQVVALSPTADKDADAWVQRTFAGVRDPHDGGYRSLLFFVSELATQDYAAEQLAVFGAVSTIMLDGGGSSQLMVAGTDYVSSTRQIPHGLLVQAGRPPDPGDGGSPDGGSPGGETEAGDGGGEAGDGGGEAGDGGTEAGDGGTEAGDGGTEAGDGGVPDEAAGTRESSKGSGCSSATVTGGLLLSGLIAAGRRGRRSRG